MDKLIIVILSVLVGIGIGQYTFSLAYAKKERNTQIKIEKIEQHYAEQMEQITNGYNHEIMLARDDAEILRNRIAATPPRVCPKQTVATGGVSEEGDTRGTVTEAEPEFGEPDWSGIVSIAQDGDEAIIQLNKLIDACGSNYKF